MNTIYIQDFIEFIRSSYYVMDFFKPMSHIVRDKLSKEPALAQAWEQQYIKTFNKSPTIRIINAT